MTNKMDFEMGRGREGGKGGKGEGIKEKREGGYMKYRSKERGRGWNGKERMLEKAEQSLSV